MNRRLFVLAVCCSKVCDRSSTPRESGRTGLPSSGGGGYLSVGLLLLLSCVTQLGFAKRGWAERPNILIAISDDQSFAHTSRLGFKAVDTPAFDQVAREGILFTNAVCGSPGCSPSRASLLTGRYPWQIEHAGTHASEFPAKYPVFTEILQKAGYAVGYCGKGWGPGNWKISGRQANPAGRSYSRLRLPQPIAGGISRTDYASNFAQFLKQRPKAKPFCFWYGGHEPHRGFEKGIGRQRGKKLEDATVPGFLPDTPEIRSDILDYCVEIEHFDQHLAGMLKTLQDAGELENTIVVVTSDNGMAFPRAKANCYEYGIHVPLAVRWGAKIKSPNRVVDDPISFVDLAPTFLEAAGLQVPTEMIGKSLDNIFASPRKGRVDTSRRFVFSARERHSSSRYGNRAYPQRAIRSDRFLLIRNFRPYRWPAGTPRKMDGQKLGPMHGGYHDIDACPSLSFLIEHRREPQIAKYFHLAVDRRPAVEMFEIKQDPDCLHNLVNDPRYRRQRDQLLTQLNEFLISTGDPRILDGGDIFETYKRYSRIRKFPPPKSPGPNFVIIMADDLGYGDIACFGNPSIKTPHLDQMSREGIRFTDFHSSGVVCSPTRAGLLTGRYQQRAGIPGVIFADPKQNRHHGLQVQETTFADVLKQWDYQTAVIGKWHLGYEPQFDPRRQGFDLFRGYVSGNIDFISHYDRMEIFDWWHDTKKNEEAGYTTHLITKHAVEFIKRNKSRPFCLYIAHEAPHSPYQGPNDVPVRGPQAQKVKLTKTFIQRAYREMVEEMDTSVGQVIQALQDQAIANNTFVLFFSDNGATKNGSNGALRGAKGSVWEGGHRVPAIAWWPGHVKPGVSNQAVISLDVAPTMFALSGATPPPGHQLDGVDLSGLLLRDEPLRKRSLFWDYRGGAAVRRGPWKLTLPRNSANSQPQLYNLMEDLPEQRNLSRMYPRQLASMMKELSQWRLDVARGATAQPSAGPSAKGSNQ